MEQDEFFIIIRWSIADIMSKLETLGYAATLENVDYLIQNYSLKRTFHDQSIVAGWEIIEDCIPFNEEGLKRL